MPNMTADEVAALIGNGERVSGLAFAAEATRRLSALAVGSPYLAGLLAQHAGRIALERDADTVTPADVAAALGRAVEESRHRLSDAALFAVRQVEARGEGAAIARLARAALEQGGRFALPEGLTGADALVEPLAGDPAGRHRFREEGLATYLWLAAADTGIAPM